MSIYTEIDTVNALAEAGKVTELSTMLNDVPPFSQWAPDLKKAWTAAIEQNLAPLSSETGGDNEVCNLALSAFKCGADSPALRKAYIAWFKQTNPRFPLLNIAIKALGLDSQNVTIEDCYRRYQAFQALAVHVYCYDKAFGRLLIREINFSKNEIFVQLDSNIEKIYTLEFLLSSCYVVAPKSPLDTIFDGGRDLHFDGRPAFDLMCYNSLLGSSAPTPELIFKIVSKIMSETEFKALFTAPSAKATPATPVAGAPSDLHKWLGDWVKNYTAIKAALKPARGKKAAAVDPETLRSRQHDAVAELVKTMKTCAENAVNGQLQKHWVQGLIFLKQQKCLSEEAITTPIGKIIEDGLFTPFTTEEGFNAICRLLPDNERAVAKEIASVFCPTILPAWDSSLSIQQLHERLLSNESLKLTHEPNLEGVGNLLVRTASNDSTAEGWANSIALLLNADLYNEQITAIVKPLADTAIIWKNQNIYIEVTDKMPARLVPSWMDITRQVVGDDFLIHTTLRLPYNLWGYAETLLKANGNEEKFIDCVYEDLAHRRGTPDHFYWLWKSAPASEKRDHYLTDAYMLFRALGRTDLKGNYLKSQRTLAKLMIVPADKNGNPLTDTENYRFLCTLMKNGDTTAITNLVNCVKQSQFLTHNDRQTLVVQITTIFPKAKAIAEKDAVVKTVTKRYVSPHALAAYRLEYQNLCDVLIPANTKAIEEARSHGDLSENSEYKYAKEHARELNRRKDEMAKEINTVEVADLNNVTVGDKVVLWSVVTLRYVKKNTTEQFTILGLYDGDTDKNYITYMAPLGETLLDKHLGDTVTLPSGLEAVIEKIEALPADLVKHLNSEEA